MTILSNADILFKAIAISCYGNFMLDNSLSNYYVISCESGGPKFKALVSSCFELFFWWEIFFVFNPDLYF